MTAQDLDYVVELVNPGCGCCSFVPVNAFATEHEALAFIAGRPGYVVEDMSDDGRGY